MREKMDTNLKEMRVGQEHLEEEIMADLKTQIVCVATSINVNQEKVDAWLEEMKGWQGCQEAMGTCLEEVKANPEMMKTGLEEIVVLVYISKKG
jgi:hypothetical protein